ncbi:MAG: MFS transporter [Gemmataceae bacterium]
MAASGLCQVAFPHVGGIGPWLLLRFAGGLAGALSVVPLETAVSAGAPPEQRSRFFACYAVALTLGGALGIGAGLHLYQPDTTLVFWVGGLAPCLGALLVTLLPAKASPAEGAGTGRPLAWRRNLLSLGSAWYQGFLEGGMLAFLSLFLLHAGYGPDEAGLLMAVTMVGVILFQLPVGWLADRFGRRPVLLLCYAGALAGLALVPWRTGPVELPILLFVVGACSGAMYPLGLSMLGADLPEADMPRAYAWYMALECLGSQLGAGLMGSARDGFGDTAMFAVGLGAGLLVLTIAFLGSLGQRRQTEAPTFERRAA